MKKYKKEIVKLTVKEALLHVFDIGASFFEASSTYHASAKECRMEIEKAKSNISEKIYYLKKHGFIQQFVEGKDSYFELTAKGKDRANQAKIDQLLGIRPEKWDGKWRVIIFDIPDKHKVSRDIFRTRLVKFGFEEVQESVYVYPFECTEAINKLTGLLFISNNVLIMISEIIQGEENVIKKFIDKNILNERDLSSTK